MMSPENIDNVCDTGNQDDIFGSSANVASGYDAFDEIFGKPEPIMTNLTITEDYSRFSQAERSSTSNNSPWSSPIPPGDYANPFEKDVFTEPANNPFTQPRTSTFSPFSGHNEDTSVAQVSNQVRDSLVLDPFAAYSSSSPNAKYEGERSSTTTFQSPLGSPYIPLPTILNSNNAFSLEAQGACIKF